jgi:hypothetical protein
VVDLNPRPQQHKRYAINLLRLCANEFVELSSSLSFLFDNNLEKMQKLSGFWLPDQKSLKDVRFDCENTEHGYFLNY